MGGPRSRVKCAFFAKKSKNGATYAYCARYGIDVYYPGAAAAHGPALTKRALQAPSLGAQQMDVEETHAPGVRVTSCRHH